MLLRFLFIYRFLGISLAVQWLRIYASSAEAAGLIPDQGTEISHGTWCGPPQKITYVSSSISLTHLTCNLPAEETEFLFCSFPKSEFCSLHPCSVLFLVCPVSWCFTAFTFIVSFFGKVVFTSVRRLASDLPLFAINSCSGLNEWWLSKREIPVVRTELVNATSFGKGS